METRYIFVTGGVTSSLGKGILASSLAKLLQASGYKVALQKFDPYINVDPGTLNPYEHGECYVTDDGAETDLDLGHYERFLNQPTSQMNNVTTGAVYQTVIEKERRGDFLGKTVQVVPHITDEIKSRFVKLAESGDYEIIITEIGGTVGDIESLPFIEAVRQFRWELNDYQTLVIHLTLIPYLKAAGELKTKPTQHSVKALQEQGLQPDILVCRSELPLNKDIKAKVARFCNVSVDSVIEAVDVDTIYEVPLKMKKENLDKVVLFKLNLMARQDVELTQWKNFLRKLKAPVHEVNIGLIGKYTELPDAYKSIKEAFTHAAAMNECKVNVQYISSEFINDKNVEEKLKPLHGILVAPGFGDRGIEGKITAIQYARTHKLPFFGICLGMQCAVIEFARNVLGLKDANSTEFNPDTPHPVIDLMEEQKKIINKGGTMRLGAYPCEISPDSKVSKIYGSCLISERHRHRFEFNNHFREDFKKNGFIPVGLNKASDLVEIMELSGHPWFIGSQFHPELKSTVANPHPLFVDFVRAAIDYSKS
ncbi:MAG: CTP synthase [Sphingobacteriales bacterium]|nr:CTP synthase [Sphingobacteriales bacterium]